MSYQAFSREHQFRRRDGEVTPLAEVSLPGFRVGTLFAKCEYLNPSGSHKFRVYSAMIADLERNGVLKRGSTLIDFSSGNGGIALAHIAKECGYRAAVVVPSTISREKIEAIRSKNGEVIELPASAPYGYIGPDDLLRARLMAARIADQQNYIFLDQANNPINVQACAVIGSEIAEQFGDRGPDYLVCGIGTGGAITGIASVLKSRYSGLRVIGVEPAEANLVAAKLAHGSSKHGSHRLSGLGSGEVSAALDLRLVDECIDVAEHEWLDAINLLHQAGYDVGKSSAAAIAVARKLFKEGREGTYLSVFFDSLSRYESEFEIHAEKGISGYREMRLGDRQPKTICFKEVAPARKVSQTVHQTNHEITPRRGSGLEPDQNGTRELITNVYEFQTFVEEQDAASTDSLDLLLSIPELSFNNGQLGASALDFLTGAVSTTKFAVGATTESRVASSSDRSEQTGAHVVLRKLYSSVESAIQAVRKGVPIIVLDEREEEGDFILACEVATPTAVNTMLHLARGVLCVAMERDRFLELEIGTASEFSSGYNETPFGEPVDYLVGTTTGVSAYDRCRTIRALGQRGAKANEFRRNGHIRTLEAHPGGLLERRGHTEAAVELSGLAGFSRAGALMEILAEDGLMARESFLLALAAQISCPIVRVAQIVKYLNEVRGKMVCLA